MNEQTKFILDLLEETLQFDDKEPEIEPEPSHKAIHPLSLKTLQRIQCSIRNPTFKHLPPLKK